MDKGLLDIGLLLEPVDMGKYDFIRLEMKEKWVVLMRPDSPLAKKEIRDCKIAVQAAADTATTHECAERACKLVRQLL